MRISEFGGNRQQINLLKRASHQNSASRSYATLALDPISGQSMGRPKSHNTLGGLHCSVDDIGKLITRIQTIDVKEARKSKIG